MAIAEAVLWGTAEASSAASWLLIVMSIDVSQHYTIVHNRSFIHERKGNQNSPLTAEIRLTIQIVGFASKS